MHINKIIAIISSHVKKIAIIISVAFFMCLQCVIVICVIAMYAIETVSNEQNAAEKVCEQDEFENTQMKNWNACLNFPFIFMHVTSLRT